VSSDSLASAAAMVNTARNDQPNAARLYFDIEVQYFSILESDISGRLP
jgi:hypothetical protein